jgi:hypothetical protein
MTETTVSSTTITLTNPSNAAIAAMTYDAGTRTAGAPNAATVRQLHGHGQSGPGVKDLADALAADVQWTFVADATPPTMRRRRQGRARPAWQRRPQ